MYGVFYIVSFFLFFFKLFYYIMTVLSFLCLLSVFFQGVHGLYELLSFHPVV